MNPILTQEYRSRWRGTRSFWLLFAIGLLATLPVLWVFASHDTVTVLGDIGGEGNTADLGIELFSTLAMGSALAWALVAPALTATSIASERERGLLEALWLAPLPRRTLVVGRLGAALLFLAELQLAAMPLAAMTLLLGGVSLHDIAIALLLSALAALEGASIGLWCSARAYRASGAMGLTFFLVALWPLLSWGLMNVDWFSSMVNSQVNLVGQLSHPVFLAWLLVTPQSVGSPLATTGYSFTGLLFLALAAHLAFCGLLLRSTVRKASFPLPLAAWGTTNRVIARWRESLQQRAHAREQARLSDRVSGALVADIPLGRLANFKNPVLAREVRSRFRLRRAGIVVTLMRYIFAAAASLFFLFLLFSAFDNSSRYEGACGLLVVLFFVTVFPVAVNAAGSFARERENGTWEALRLSLLGEKAVLWAKWISPQVTVFYYTAAGWAVLPLFLGFGGGFVKPGMPLAEMAAGVCLVVASVGFAAALGLWMSTRFKTTATATAFTLVVLLLSPLMHGAVATVCLGTFPVGPKAYLTVQDYSNPPGTDWSESFSLAVQHSPPFLLFDHPSLRGYGYSAWGDDYPDIAILSTALTCCFTGCLLFSTWLTLRRETRRTGRLATG